MKTTSIFINDIKFPLFFLFFFMFTTLDVDKTVSAVLIETRSQFHNSPCFQSERPPIQEASSRQASNRALLPPVNGGLWEWLLLERVVLLVQGLPPLGQQRSRRQGPGAVQEQCQTVRPTPLQERHHYEPLCKGRLQRCVGISDSFVHQYFLECFNCSAEFQFQAVDLNWNC